MKRTAIVTGGYGAIGKAIAGGLALNGYRVCLVGRDLSLLQKAQTDLIKQTANKDIFVEQVDLSLHQQILEFSQRWKEPLHLLINNAATAPKRRTETSEGIETQWATNVLGYVWMIRYFNPFMQNQPDARIVNVASYWAGGLDMSDIEFRSRFYDNNTAYRQAKQANRMLSAAFSENLKPFGITVNSCHPGDVNSKLSNSFGFGGVETPDEGAATPLFLALSPEMKGVSGLYFEHLKPATCQFSKDRIGIQKLFDLCLNYKVL
ncbi:MAG: SDR family NAD(P)-dependent oxidoreductase [Bacteroidetes bacterium]|nr:SDR family NAD(P)-dependent oxidoreductase [Bacteroidota bacterium]